MKYMFIRLKNYIGIYNGLQLNEIAVDFSRARHKMILIKGANGSGKSTLYNAISPLPDSNDKFIPGLPAEKELFIDNQGNIYNIKFIHGIKPNGERDTTKAFLFKNGIDMNPNGNVSSYKDFIYNEFNLDANFMALSQLSSEDKGLASKRPAERKKFVNSIISTLDVYNNIHKAISKRSSILKSMMNSIVVKLDQLGDSKKLQSQLQSINDRIIELENLKNKNIEDLAGYKSIVSLTDPDGSIQNMYTIAVQNMNKVDVEITSIYSNISTMLKKLDLNIDSNIINQYESLKEDITRLSFDIQLQESNADRLLIEREEDYKSLQQKLQRAKSLKSDKNYDELVISLKEYRNTVGNIERQFRNIGIEDGLSLTKDEYIIGLNTLKDIKDIIDSFKSYSYHNSMQTAIVYVNNGEYPDIDYIEHSIDIVSNEIDSLKEELIRYSELYKISKKLEFRHEDCTITNCMFIKDALDAQSQNPQENISTINNTLQDKEELLLSLMNSKEESIEVIRYINAIKNIIRAIDINANILNKLPIGNRYTNKGIFLKRLSDNDTFDDIDAVYRYIDMANLFEEYKIAKDVLLKLETEYTIYESKHSILEDINKDIMELNSKLSHICNNIDNTEAGIVVMKTALLNKNELLLKYDTLIDKLNEWDKFKEERINITNSISNIQSNISKIQDACFMIDGITNEIDKINKNLSPLYDERDTLKHAIALTIDYNAELESYKQSYDILETIKFYSSPTTGIQLIFMDLYMNKILEMSNELLQKFFGGQYVIMPFVINDSEFRIPVQGNGFLNDDITSMSSGQVAILSMVISFSLLFQSSTKYNILKMDEIDGPLDSDNRFQFANLIQQFSSMLGIEQIFLISHNTEIDTSTCDVILLKSSPDYDLSGANIIYKY